MSSGTNSSSPDYKVLHRPVPIAWPISFMEGCIVRMQLVSFCHGNENITTVGRERPCQGGSESLCLGVGVTTLWAPGVPEYLSVPPWVHFGKESLCPLAQRGIPLGTPEQRRRLEPGMHRQGHSATQ